jgi:choline dehydrogenase-like flavoprotein
MSISDRIVGGSASIVVVGAGPVGLAIASRLASHGDEVVVVEAGGAHARQHTGDDVAAIESGHPFPHPISESRARSIGGTSQMWIEGFFRCRPLDHSSFKPRADGLHGGWPLDASELDRHIGDASTILALSDGSFDPEALLEDGEHLVTSEVLRTGLFRIGDLEQIRRFVDRTIARPEITVLPNTETLSIRQDDDGRVRGVRVVSLDGSQRDLECAAVVLAAGGLENARLLLLSTDCDERGIGNASGLVGRGFMEHPHIALGHLVPADTADLSKFDRREGRNGRTEGYLTLTDEAHLEHHLPEVGIWLHPVSLRQSIGDLRTAAGALRTAGRESRREFAWSVRRLASTTIDRVAHRRSRRFHRLVSCELEQFPTTESSVSLADKRDRFGRPQVHVHWDLGPEFDDIHDRLISLLAPALASAGLGRLVPFPAGDPRRAFGVGNHHIGTTRMGAQPSDGVVDTNCKVHDVDGLYVAGSSVFPTSGAANPTLTAVALGLRLADHLAELQRAPARAVDRRGVAH